MKKLLYGGAAVGLALGLAIPARGVAQAEHQSLAPAGGETWLGSHFVGQKTSERPTVAIVGPANGAACERQQVRYIFLSGGWSRNPRPPEMIVRGTWMAVDGGTYECRATLEWALAEEPGRQALWARLERPQTTPPDSAPDSTWRVTEFEASAHAWPTLLVGLAWLDRRVPAVVEPDSATREEKRARVQQMVGVDFPLPFLGNLAGPRTARVVDRVRLLVGTSFGDPGYDLYAGFSVAALYGGARGGALPVQLYAGRRFGLESGDTFFAAATLDAPAVLAWAVRGLGFR